MNEEEAKKVEELKQMLLVRLLDSGARQRLNNIRIANPAFAEQLEAMLLVYAQKTGGKRIDEATLVEIAKKARGERPKGKIRRM